MGGRASSPRHSWIVAWHVRCPLPLLGEPEFDISSDWGFTERAAELADLSRIASLHNARLRNICTVRTYSTPPPFHPHSRPRVSRHGLFVSRQAKGLGIRLATPSPADAHAARGVKYRSRHKGFRAGEKAKMAAITGESIFGSGSESAEQARRKAVLVKAAKLGLKTRGMRLLEPGEGGGGGGRASRRPGPVSSCSRGTGSSRPSSAEKHGQDSVRRGSRRRRGDDKTPTGSGKGIRGGEAAVVVVDDDRGVPEMSGDDVDLFGESGRGGLLNVREAEACAKKAAALPRKKRRKRSSSMKPSLAAAGAVSSNDALAAIASSY